MLLKRKVYPYLLILPIILLMLGLVFYPAAITFVDSFQSMNLTRPQSTHFIGFSNYVQLWKDPNVRQAFLNTTWYFVLAVVFGFLGGLAFALILRRKFWCRGLVLAIVILPWAFPPVVNSAIWKWIYDPTYGVFNDILLHIGLIHTYQPLLAYKVWSILLIMIVHVWRMIPLTTIILLAGLQTIPGDILQAAAIDGASRWQRFTRITMPLLKPTILIVLMQSTLASIHLFDEIYVLTGTALDTRSLMIQTYLIAFRQLDLGMGMALSFLITMIIVVIGLIYFGILRDEGGRQA